MSASTSVAVSGNGSPGSPFQPSVSRSGDDGNLLELRGNGVYVGPPTILGPDGTPISPPATPGDPIRVPAPCILDYNGDPITPTPEGCIQLPAAGVPPAFGCGLSTLEDGTLIAGVRAWSDGASLFSTLFAGDVDDGSPIYCDSDGLLRGAPEHTSIITSLASHLLDPDLVTLDDGGTYTSPDSPGLGITNPSPARQMNVLAHLTAVCDITSPAKSGTVVTLQYRINGGSWHDARQVRWPEALNDAGPTIREAKEVNGRVNSVLLASDAWVLEARVQVEHTGDGDPPTVTEIRLGATAIGVTE